MIANSTDSPGCDGIAPDIGASEYDPAGQTGVTREAVAVVRVSSRRSNGSSRSPRCSPGQGDECKIELDAANRGKKLAASGVHNVRT